MFLPVPRPQHWALSAKEQGVSGWDPHAHPALLLNQTAQAPPA